MKKITISKNDVGIRLDKFLAKILSEAPMSVVYKSLRKKKVKINNKRVTDGNIRLEENDVLELYISDEFFGKNIKSTKSEKNVIPDTYKNKIISEFEKMIVYEDDNIIIMNKPTGVLSQDDDKNNCQTSLELMLRLYLKSKNEISDLSAYIPSLCHRIDRNTAGLVIGAKNSASHRIIAEKIKLREIRKFYICETEGRIKSGNGLIKGYITKKNNKSIFSVKESNNSKLSEMNYNVIKYNDKENISTVEVELLTGRTHQIRAGFSYLGHPLVGDVKYGAKKDGKKEFQHLTAYKIVFDFTTDAAQLNYLREKVIKINL